MFGNWGVVRRGMWPALLACAVLAAAASARAQNACQKDEIFGGYAALIPNGWGDLDYKINTIPNAFDVSNTYYLPNAHNVGLLVDGSGHFKGSTTPPNLQNGSNDSTGVGYALAGVQYKWHGGSVSPFVRGFAGGANISPDCCHGMEWSFAGGGGGGVDWNATPTISIRFVQADYIYSSYSHIFPSTHSTTWNSMRLAAGVVFNLGNYCTQAPVACTASASPSEVSAGEPVRLNATGSNFNPKHTLTYGWASSGGKIANPASQASEIDTTGLAAGSYSITATVTDPKMKQGNSASCPATFVVKAPPPQLPPTVSCMVDPSMIDPGQSATITMTAMSPDRRPMTFKWSSTGGSLSGTGTTANVTAGKSDAGNTITVTGTATDDRSLSASCDVRVSVPKTPEPCVKILDWGECTFEKDPRRPARVDNACKDILDGLVLKIQGAQNGKLVVVGYVDQSEAQSTNLAAQRAANVLYYLANDSSPTVDASRMEAHQGGVQGKATHFYFVPEGKLCEGQVELGTLVDSSKVKGQTRAVPAHKKKVEK